MEQTVFNKMKVKQGYSACILYPPESYPLEVPELSFDDSEAQVDFVHLFVSSREQFDERVNQALAKRKDNGLFWISYPKSKGKNKYDINRDSLWDLSIPYGIHPIAQISLDEAWSAVRFANNRPGEKYERPKK